jgi:anti-sigma factor RsiW
LVSCSSSEALFERYLDDTLVPAQRARLLSHLDRCGRCKGVLDELRVVDALMAAPRAVALPENFTFATMAEVRSLPHPHGSPAPAAAYLVSYLAAAWLLIGAGFLLASSAMRAFGETALDVAAQLAHPLGLLGHIATRILDDFGAFGTIVGVAIALDVMLALALVFGFTVVRPRLMERLRS